MYVIEQAKARIVKRLYAKRAFSKGHMLEVNILKCIPRAYRKIGRAALDELIKEGIVCAYGKTSFGIAYQLNIDCLAEIEAYIKVEKIADEG